MKRFVDKVAMVTGAAGGIGAAVTARLLDEGAHVLVTDLNTPTPPIERDAHPAQTIRCASLDVTDQSEVETTVAGWRGETGRLDVLVNCAGIREIVPTLELSLDEWDRVIAVNLTGTFLVSQAAARVMVADERGGAVVNLASTAGLFGIPRRSAYVAAKHGVVGLTKQMALEFASEEIRFNAVAPGVTRTEMTEQYFDEPDAVARLRTSHPLHGFGLADDIAAAVLHLASEEARFTTGAVLSVDGGFAAGKVI